MSDTPPPSSFPTAPKGPGQVPSARADGQNRQNVEIVSISRELRDLPARERIEGRVIERAPERNSVAVRTSRGDVEVRLPPDRALPPRGAAVEIEIPRQTASRAEMAARQLILRVNAEQAQSPPKTQPPVGQARPPSYPALSPSPPPQNANTPPATLQPGQVIRLTPLPPAAWDGIEAPAPATQLRGALTPSASVEALSALRLSALPGASSVGISAALPNALAGTFINSGTSFLSTNITGQQVSNSIAPITQALNISAASSFNAITSGSFSGSLTIALLETNPGAAAPSFAALSQSAAIPAVDVSIQNVRPGPVVLSAPNSTSSMTHTLESFQQYSSSSPLTSFRALSVGVTAQGQPVVALQIFPQTPALLFVLNSPLVPPIGQEFYVSLPHQAILPSLSGQIQGTGNLAPLPLPQTGSLQPGLWPALMDVLETLQAASPPAAQNFLNSIPTPQNPAQFGPALLLIMAALRGGDLSNWLGERQHDLLRRLGKGDLLARLSGDLTAGGRGSADITSGEWRTTAMPMAFDGDIYKVILHSKTGGGEEEPQAESGHHNHTRFIFDLSFPRMGNVQVDGLFRPYGSQLKLDLVVRTESDLSASMKQKMRQNYTEISTDTGLVGSLSFQAEPDAFYVINNDRERFGVMT